MSGLGIELWVIFILAAIALGIGAYFMARRDDSLDLDTDRRDEQRRNVERRTGVDRRSLSRLLHDRLHNPGRRNSDRRETERRQTGEWKSDIEQVRERVETVKQEERNRQAQ